MCLIVFAWRPEHPQPLVLAANRDEFYDRACMPLAEWPEVPGLYAGRDLMPLTDVRSYAGAAIAGQFGVPKRALEDVIFPGLRIEKMPGILL